jgi:hypothetical protein
LASSSLQEIISSESDGQAGTGSRAATAGRPKVRLAKKRRQEASSFSRPAGVSSTGAKAAESQGVLPALTDDAQPGSLAFKAVQWDKRKGCAHFKYKEEHCQTTLKLCGNSQEHALRIARLLYLKFVDGWQKPKVLEFRNKLYHQLSLHLHTSAARCPGATEAGASASAMAPAKASGRPRAPHHPLGPTRVASRTAISMA